MQQISDDIILSERLLLYLASDGVQRLPRPQHQQELAQRDAAAAAAVAQGWRKLG